MNTLEYLGIGFGLVLLLELTINRPGWRVVAYGVVMAISIGALLAMQGCASFTNPDREIRVTEYSGTASPGLVGAPYVSGDLVVTGCRLVLSKVDGRGCLTYEGKAWDTASYMAAMHTSGVLVLKDGKIVLERYGLDRGPNER